MKRGWLCLLLCLACGLRAEAPMGKTLPETGYIEVRNNYFTCTFFPRHMFPVWFENPDGVPFPEIVRFLDRAVIGKTAYWLYTDLWAEQTVLTNTAQEFSIRCSGVYCHVEGDKVAPGGLRAVYTYTIRRDSPTIKVVADIRREGGEEMNLVFLQPAWSMKEDFHGIWRNEKLVKLSPGYSFREARSAAFGKTGMTVMVEFNNRDPVVMARYKCQDGFSSLMAFGKRVKGNSFHLTGYLTLRSSF